MNTNDIKLIIDEYYEAYARQDDVQIIQLAARMAAILGVIADTQDSTIGN